VRRENRKRKGGKEVENAGSKARRENGEMVKGNHIDNEVY